MPWSLAEAQSIIRNGGPSLPAPMTPMPSHVPGGRVQPGTIDLYAQPEVRNPDDTTSTVRSFSVNLDGREVLLPTVTPDGRSLTEDEAIAEYQRTGRHLGIFDSPTSANVYAEQLHRDYAAGKYQPHMRPMPSHHATATRSTPTYTIDEAQAIIRGRDQSLLTAGTAHAIQDPLLGMSADAASRPAVSLAPTVEPPPRMSPLSVLNAPSAATGTALGHLLDRPGDAIGALAAGAQEGARALVHADTPANSPSRELQRRGMPLGPWQAFVMDAALDPLNAIPGPGQAEHAAPAVAAMLSPAVIARLRRLAQRLRRGAKAVGRGATEAAEAAATSVARDVADVAPIPRPEPGTFTTVPGLTDVLEHGGAPVPGTTPVRLPGDPQQAGTLTAGAQLADAERIDRFIGRHVLIDEGEDRALIAEILQKGSRFASHRRRPMTWAQTDAVADDIVVDLTKRLPKGTTLNAEHTEALRRTTMGLVNRASTLAARLTKLEETGQAVTPALKADALLATQEAVIGIQSLLGVRAEAGRTLNIYKKLAKARRTNDIAFIQRALEKGADTLSAAKALAALRTPVERYRYLRDLAKPTAQDYWRWYFISNLLSGPVTHMRNAVGNGTRTALSLAEPLVDRQGREAMAGVAGAWAGAKEGARKAVFMLREGFNLDDAERLAERGPEIGGSAASRRALNIIGRGLEASDQFFRTVNAEAAAWQGAFRRVQAQGLTPGTTEFENALAAMLADRPQDLIDEMAEAGAESVFRQQEPGLISRKAQEARTAADKFMVEKVGKPVEMMTGSKVLGGLASMPVGTFVLPFVQTPANILRASARFSPLGILEANYTRALAAQATDAATKARLTRQALRMARQGKLGTATLAPLAFLVAEGRVTGSGPSDRGEREQWLAEGNQPNSIRIGDTWYSYQSVTPLATPLALLANAYETWKADGVPPDVGTFVFKLGNSILSQSYLSSVLLLAEAVNDPDRFGQRFIGRTVTGLVPLSSLLRSVQRTVDPRMRESRTVAENVKGSLPVLAEDVPVRTDFAGEPILYKGTAAERFISPITRSEMVDDPLRKELRRTGARLGQLSAQHERIKGIPLDRDQGARLKAAIGKAQAAAMRQAIADPSFRDLPIDQQVVTLEQVASEARGAVRTAVRDAMQQRVVATVRELQTTADPKRREQLQAQVAAWRKALRASAQ